MMIGRRRYYRRAWRDRGRESFRRGDDNPAESAVGVGADLARYRLATGAAVGPPLLAASGFQAGPCCRARRRKQTKFRSASNRVADHETSITRRPPAAILPGVRWRRFYPAFAGGDLPASAAAMSSAASRLSLLHLLHLLRVLLLHLLRLLLVLLLHLLGSRRGSLLLRQLLMFIVLLLL